MNYFENKRIFITGACGTVGRELLRLLTQDERYNPAEIVGIDNNESELFFLEGDYVDDPRIRLFLGDIRDPQKLMSLSDQTDIIFHTAALKHVSLCETSPTDAVQSNIIGVQNLINAASHNNVETVIFTSSDKAVNPTNVMGTSKLMGERLITAAHNTQRGEGPVFASTRFGNVLGSRGSVIPVFRAQIAAGGPVTLTHPEMTRFIMSIEQAAELVLSSAGLARSGEVFVTKMPVLCIKHLAEVMIEELAEDYGYKPDDIQVNEIGIRPGEKLYEELMNSEETRRTVELADFFVVKPAFAGYYKDVDFGYPGVVAESVDEPYISSMDDIMTHEEIRNFLNKYGLLGKQTKRESGHKKQFWPGDEKR